MSKVGKRQPDSIDIHVGSRVKLRRTTSGMSQIELAKRLGLTFQQVAKYEHGINRIGASRLQNIAEIFNVHVSYFFERDTEAQGEETATAERSKDDHVRTFMTSPEGLKLNTEFVKIADPKIRQSIIELIKTLAANDDE